MAPVGAAQWMSATRPTVHSTSCRGGTFGQGALSDDKRWMAGPEEVAGVDEERLPYHHNIPSLYVQLGRAEARHGGTSTQCIDLNLPSQLCTAVARGAQRLPAHDADHDAHTERPTFPSAAGPASPNHSLSTAARTPRASALVAETMGSSSTVQPDPDVTRGNASRPITDAPDGTQIGRHLEVPAMSARPSPTECAFEVGLGVIAAAGTATGGMSRKLSCLTG